jgi:hypothetical protein
LYQGILWLFEEEIRKYIKPEVQEKAGLAMQSLGAVLEYSAWLPWILIPLVVGVLLVWTYFESRKENKSKFNETNSFNQKNATSQEDRSPTMKIPPNSVISIDQKGGITAGTVNITTDIPEPRFKWTTRLTNKKNGSKYTSQFMLRIDTKVPIPNLLLQMNAKTITGMRAIPQRSGGGMHGYSSIRDGFAFTTLINAYGTYKITVNSSEPEMFTWNVSSK